MNTNTMELNPNARELNLDELELVSAGRWCLKDAITGGVIGGTCFGMLGACLGGLPGALIGGTVGAAAGVGLAAVV